jgi:membrane protein DedA with SNARE-associated domain
MQDWVVRLIDWGGYAGIFLLSLAETIIVPLPSELILPVAGMRAANGPLDIGGVILASTAGSMTGNTIWYYAARSVGLVRLKHFIDRHGRWLGIEWRDVEQVRSLFGRFGSAIVFAGRLLPGVRTFVSVPAGVVRMPALPFLLWSTLGTGIFAAAFAGAGYAAGKQLRWIEQLAGPAASIAIAMIALFYIWRQLTWHRRADRLRLGAGPRDTGSQGEPDPAPSITEA